MEKVNIITARVYRGKDVLAEYKINKKINRADVKDFSEKIKKKCLKDIKQDLDVILSTGIIRA